MNDKQEGRKKKNSEVYQQQKYFGIFWQQKIYDYDRTISGQMWKVFTEIFFDWSRNFWGDSETQVENWYYISVIYSVISLFVIAK